ncbi:MAG: hypothetical protein NDJ90_09685 [Oligoflexia bacterium]|nr:hypothetical protein [Oligoflexia bacterium]
MRFHRFPAFAILLVLLAPAASAQPQPTTPTPTASVLIEQEGYRFRVEVDPAAGRASLYSLTRRRLPRQLNLLLFENESTGETVTLQPVAPLDPSQTAEYQGRISPKSGRYVAFELQFGIGGKRFKRFRGELPPSATLPQAAGQAGG